MFPRTKSILWTSRRSTNRIRKILLLLSMALVVEKDVVGDEEEDAAVVGEEVQTLLKKTLMMNLQSPRNRPSDLDEL